MQKILSSSTPLLQMNFSPPTQNFEPWATRSPASNQAPLLCYMRRPKLLVGTPTTYHRWINRSRKTLSWCRAKPPDEWEYPLGWAQAECDRWVQPPDYGHKYISISFEEKSIPCSCCNSKAVAGSWQRPFPRAPCPERDAEVASSISSYSISHIRSAACYHWVTVRHSLPAMLGSLSNP